MNRQGWLWVVVIAVLALVVACARKQEVLSQGDDGTVTGVETETAASAPPPFTDEEAGRESQLGDVTPKPAPRPVTEPMPAEASPDPNLNTQLESTESSEGGAGTYHEYVRDGDGEQPQAAAATPPPSATPYSTQAPADVPMILGTEALRQTEEMSSPERQAPSRPRLGGSVAMTPASPPPPKGKAAYGAARRARTAAPAAQQKPTYEGFGQAFDEVWVIQRPDHEAAPVSRDRPGGGELRTTPPDGGEEVPLPLKHTAVKASVNGYLASVRVTQQYQNPYGEKIEAVYVFPLPQNAAVSEFVMRIGERNIRGIIREKEEAKRIYQQARNQGHVASLLTQERPNVFTQKVANIEPGKRIDVDILYFNTLAYHDGEYSFVFPMVVGPRYNPPGFQDGIGAVGRNSPGASGQPVEVPYLKPGERTGHDISLAVDLDAGVSIEDLYSNTHAIDVERPGASTARVLIRPSDTLPNKDFVLRYRVAGNTVKSALLTERDEDGGYFTLLLQPPANLKDLPRTPKEMVFVLDCSGSMNGWPMAKAKAAMNRALKNLNRDDTFQIIRFSSNASAFGPDPVPATPANVKKGLAYIETLRGSGGTQMIEGIKAALDFPHDPKRFRIVSFMTDGYIGNEAQILAEIDRRLGDARIFSFGVGSSVNRYLIERMAKVGRGAVAYITTRDSDVEAVDRFYDRIGHPGLTDISVDWGGMEVSDLYPRRLPDLFVGRPVVVTGRFKGHGDTTVRINGSVAGENQTLAVDVRMDDPEERQKGISKLWARARIADLMDTMATDGAGHLASEVKDTALHHGLVSAYTAFVAVDSTRRTEGDHGTTVAVPVAMPEGVRYDTTVQD